MRSALLDDDIAVAVIDALTSQICVLNQDGIITAVNRAWTQFSAENSGGRVFDPVGVNYLSICENAGGPASDEAPGFLCGLRAVLDGDREYFQIEYPCHSPKETRWFLASVSPLRRRSDRFKLPSMGAVVSHMNITDRKIVELNYARLASTDPLTGLPNRRFFDEMAKLELESFLRFSKPFSILMMDLDHFKSINDTHGHQVGDDVLRCVASIGKSVFRSADLFARWGGEEFACLLPATDESGAVSTAEKLRIAIKDSSNLNGETVIPVTASIGLSSIGSGDQKVEDVLTRADRALYRAKREGRNCVRTGCSYLS